MILENGESSLCLAICNGHLEIVNVLIEVGVEVNKANNNGDKPLHEASWCRKLEAVKRLIRANADVRIENNQGKAPVDVAATDEIIDLIHQDHPRR